MNKLNERLTLIANISVVLGIIFLAFEQQQNKQAIQAQTRDSVTEKQMSWLESLYTNPGATATSRFLAASIGAAHLSRVFTVGRSSLLL